MIRTLEPAVWCLSLSFLDVRHYHHTGTLSHVIITTLERCLTSLSPLWENTVSRHYHHAGTGRAVSRHCHHTGTGRAASRHYHHAGTGRAVSRHYHHAGTGRAVSRHHHHTGTLSHVIITTLEHCLTSLSPHWNTVSRHYHHTGTLSHVIITTLEHCLTSLSPHWNIVSRHYHHTGTLSHVIITTLERCLTSLSPHWNTVSRHYHHIGKTLSHVIITRLERCLTSLSPHWNTVSRHYHHIWKTLSHVITTTLEHCLTSLSPHLENIVSPHYHHTGTGRTVSRHYHHAGTGRAVSRHWQSDGRPTCTADSRTLFFFSSAECLHVPRHAQNPSVLINQERRTEGGRRGTRGNVWKEPGIDYCLWTLPPIPAGKRPPWTSHFNECCSRRKQIKSCRLTWRNSQKPGRGWGGGGGKERVKGGIKHTHTKGRMTEKQTETEREGGRRETDGNRQTEIGGNRKGE